VRRPPNDPGCLSSYPDFRCYVPSFVGNCPGSSTAQSLVRFLRDFITPIRRLPIVTRVSGMTTSFWLARTPRFALRLADSCDARCARSTSASQHIHYEHPRPVGSCFVIGGLRYRCESQGMRRFTTPRIASAGPTLIRWGAFSSPRRDVGLEPLALLSHPMSFPSGACARGGLSHWVPRPLLPQHP
jgi:hypothetical protein